MAFEIVPGDILLLEAGDIVAADGTIIEAWRLQMNEATLTGVMRVRDIWGEEPQEILRIAASCCDAELANGRAFEDLALILPCAMIPSTLIEVKKLFYRAS